MLMGFLYAHRNFDEVLSSFAEPFLESSSFLESCSSLYEEDNLKVRAVAEGYQYKV